MRVRDRLLLVFIGLALSFNYFTERVLADNLNDAIQSYNSEDYKGALKILKEEVKQNPDNREAYKWIAKTYEALFDIEKSMEAYKIYQNLKASPTNLTDNAAPTLRPTIIPLPTPRPTAIPFPTAYPIPKPTKKPVYRPMPTPVPSPKSTLSPVYDGWSSISIMELKSEKSVKLISRNSADMTEVDEKAGRGKEFILVRCKIKYKKDIIIKTNSNEITLSDDNNRLYRIYAMSTYKFQYGGNKASKKSEVLQAGDYFQLSRKDSRDTILFLFKIDEDSKPKVLRIMGYKDLPLAKFNS